MQSGRQASKKAGNKQPKASSQGAGVLNPSGPKPKVAANQRLVPIKKDVPSQCVEERKDSIAPVNSGSPNVKSKDIRIHSSRKSQIPSENESARASLAMDRVPIPIEVTTVAAKTVPASCRAEAQTRFLQQSKAICIELYNVAAARASEQSHNQREFIQQIITTVTFALKVSKQYPKAKFISNNAQGMNIDEEAQAKLKADNCFVSHQYSAPPGASSPDYLETRVVDFHPSHI